MLKIIHGFHSIDSQNLKLRNGVAVSRIEGEDENPWSDTLVNVAPFNL